MPDRLLEPRLWDNLKPMQLSPDEISRLSPDERLTLIAQLWDSLGDDEIAITVPQQRELEKRLFTIKRDRADGVLWERLKAELEQRCP